MQRTYSTELQSLTPNLDAILESSCALFGQVCRYYYNHRYLLGEEAKDIKRESLRLFEMNGRWWNGVRSSVDGQMAAAKESRKLAMDSLATAIAKQKAKVKRLTEQRIQALSAAGMRFRKAASTRSPGKWRETIQGAEGKLLRLQHKLDRLKDDIVENHAPRVCFGSRKLFNSQHHLADNGLSSHREWKASWHEARHNQFFLVGSKDETAGNQNVRAVPVGTDNPRDFEIFITLPVAIIGSSPRRVSLGIVKLSNEGARSLHYALEHHIAVSWRIVRTLETTRTGGVARSRKRAGKSGGDAHKCYASDSTPHTWLVHFSTDLQPCEQSSLSSAGAIGIDFNADHVAGCRIDRSGNIVEVKRFPLITRGKTSDQVTQVAADAVKSIVEWAVREKVPVVAEKLDFSKKKKELGKDKSPYGKRYARMLSSLSYSKFFQLLQSRCFDKGVAFHQVNPAYTSIIGKANYARRLGISSHQAAAGVIARRYFKFSERPMCSQDPHAPDFDQSDRNRHVWTYWHKVATSSSRSKRRSNPHSVSATLDLPLRTASKESGCVSNGMTADIWGRPVIPLSTGVRAA